MAAPNCFRCGSEGVAAFCPRCGAPVPPAAKSASTPLHVLYEEFVATGERRGFLTVLARMVRRPVRTTLELAHDRTFAGATSFYLVSSALSIALYRVFDPYISSPQNTPSGNDPVEQFIEAHASEVATAAAVVQVIALYLSSYVAVHLVSGRRKNLRSSWKVVALTLGTTQVITILGALVVGALRLVGAKPVPPPGFDLLEGSIHAAHFSLQLLYVLLVTRRHWELSWMRSLGAVALSLIGMLVVMVTMIGWAYVTLSLYFSLSGSG